MKHRSAFRIIALLTLTLAILALLALGCGPTAPTGQDGASTPKTQATDMPEPTPEATDPPPTRNPKLGSVLNARVVEYEKQRSSQSGATGQAKAERSITVEIFLTIGDVVGIRRFLEDNQGSVTLVIEDSAGSYLEATVPVSLLGRLSQRSDVLVVSTTEQLYPNLDGSLNDLLAEYEAGFLSAEEAAARAPQHDGQKINVHFEIECEHLEGIKSFSSANGSFLHPDQVDDTCAASATTDHIYTGVPITVLGLLSNQPGVIHVWPIHGSIPLSTSLTPTPTPTITPGADVRAFRLFPSFRT